MKLGTLVAFIIAIVINSTPLSKLSAEEFRVAVVDLTRILNETKEAKDERKKLEGITAKKRKEIEDKKEALQKRERELTESKVAKDSEEAEKLRQEARDLARLLKDSEEDLKKEYLKTTKDLLDEANQVIQAYADKQQLSMVLEKSEGQRGPILYKKDALDITDEIIKELNR